MNKNIGPYQVVELSPGRRMMVSLLDLPRPQHCMYGLLEIDVTCAKQFIEEYKARTGELLSFTGYLIFCLARAVDENKVVQSYRKGHKQLVLFDDVDVGMMVERKVGDKHALMGHVLRAANRKSYLDIHREIRAVQAAPVLPSRGMPAWVRRGLLLPPPLSNLFRAVLGAVTRRDPTFFVALTGTVGVTAVGMFGEGEGGWGLFAPEHSLSLIVGSTAWKPAIVGEGIAGRVMPREILNLTVTFDHTIVDGAPAARFTRRLIELIESSYGLDEADLPQRSPNCGKEHKHAMATYHPDSSAVARIGAGERQPGSVRGAGSGASYSG